MTILDTAERFLRDQNLAEASLAVAISGGADSVALAVALAALRDRCGFSLSLAHVNYNLRGEESARETAFVRALAESLALPLRYHEVALGDGSAMEERAREVRYRFFESLRGEVDALLLAHTMNDQAETLLFRLARGTGIHGAGAMAAVRDGFYYRPLLDITRDEIIAFLNARGQQWCEDSSNSDRRYQRNRIRHEVLPQLEQVNSEAVRHLATFAAAMQERSAAEQADAAKQLHRAERYRDSDAALLSFGEAPAGTMVHQLLSQFGIEPSQASVEAVRSGFGSCGELLLPKGYHLLFLQQLLLLIPRESTLFDIKPTPLNREQCAPSPLFSFKVSPSETSAEGRNRLVRIPEPLWPLQIRPITEDDQLVPFGRKSAVTCRSLLKKTGIPAWLRARWPLVCDSSGRPLWLPTVAYSEHGRVDDGVVSRFCRVQTLLENSHRA